MGWSAIQLLRGSTQLLLRLTELSLQVGLYATSHLPWMTRIPSSLIVRSGLEIVHWTQYLLQDQNQPLLLT